jgi:pimeloyl-ACP methyl ester carboxylesterase
MTAPFETATSADGTPIAFARSGHGRPVVLIGGAFSDRATAAPLASVMAPHFTVIVYDRRGHGDSGDAAAYAVEREVEDLHAVIERAGGRAAVVGHSSGAILGLEAARSVGPVERVVAYEPPYIVDGRARPFDDLVDRLRALVAADRRGDAVALFQTEAVGIPAPVVEGLRQTEMWPGLLRLAHTLPYDVEITGPGNRLRSDHLAQVAVPALVIVGTAGFPWMMSGTRAAAAAVPQGRHMTIEGADHGTPQSHPELLLPLLLDFLA